MSRIKLASLAGLAVVGSLALPGTAKAQTFWDFVALNSVPASKGAPSAVYANSRTVSNAGLGSVLFTAALNAGVVNSTPMISFNWRSDMVVPNDEKGVGACGHSSSGLPGTCNSGASDYEIGEFDDVQWLFLTLTGLTPGNILNSVRISSLQVGEAYSFDVCTSSLYTTCTNYNGVGTNSNANIVTVNLSPGDQSRQYLRFTRGTSGDYYVAGMTTNSSLGDVVTPEPGSMGLLATGLVGLAGAGVWRRRNRKGLK